MPPLHCIATVCGRCTYRCISEGGENDRYTYLWRRRSLGLAIGALQPWRALAGVRYGARGLQPMADAKHNRKRNLNRSLLLVDEGASETSKMDLIAHQKVIDDAVQRDERRRAAHKTAQEDLLDEGDVNGVCDS